MSRAFRNSSLVALLIVSMGAVGCGSKSARSDSLNAKERATAVQSAFTNSSEEVRLEAGAVVSAVQAENSVAAYAQLESLAGKPALTPDQRQAVFEMQMALIQQLQAESAKGNSAAEQLLEKYRASK